MKNRDYKKDIRINEHDLMTEWMEQPSLYLYYSDMFAAAVYERDRLKLKLEYMISKIDSEIRANCKKFGFESRPTETAIKNAILTDPRCKKADLKHLKAARQTNLLLGVKISFEHRKKALENAVSLQITGYHSEPRNKLKDIFEKKHSGHNKEHKNELNKERKKIKKKDKEKSRNKKSCKMEVKE